MFHSEKSSTDGLQTYCKNCQGTRTYTYLSNFEPFIKNLYRDVKNNSKKRNIKVDITIDDIFKKYKDVKCMYTKIKMTHNKIPKSKDDLRTTTTNPYNISVDRIDRNKHYTYDNTQLITVSCNHMKWNLKENDFLFTCKLIVENFQK
jgi:hypothetical protein